jgi:hypothetical protein
MGFVFTFLLVLDGSSTIEGTERRQGRTEDLGTEEGIGSNYG